jgi:hypothetical protein
MDDRTRIALGLGVGAIAGGFVAFQLEPQIEGLIGEAERLTAAFDRTRRAVKDGLATLNPPEGEARADDIDWAH